MKRGLILMTLALGATAPASAQLLGMPVWNSPKGGTGLTIDGDYGKPNNNAGSGSAFGGRATLGLGTLSVTAGVDSWKPSGASSSVTSFGGDVAFRVIGGSLLPFAVNLQGGAAHASSGGLTQTNVIGAVGISAVLPSPGISIEPYVSPGIRYTKQTDQRVSRPRRQHHQLRLRRGRQRGFRHVRRARRLRLHQGQRWQPRRLRHRRPRGDQSPAGDVRQFTFSSDVDSFGARRLRRAPLFWETRATAHFSRPGGRALHRRRRLRLELR